MENKEIYPQTIEGNFTTLQAFPENKITIEDSKKIEVFGTQEQISEMFKDWSLYFGEIKNPDNNKKNSGLGGSKYAPLDTVLNTIRPTMSKYGLSMIQSPPYTVNEKLFVKTVVTHKSGAIMSFPAAESKLTRPNNAVSEIQVLGLTATYLRRFSANAVAGIQGEIDDDGNSLADKKSNSQTPKEPTKEEIKLKEKQDEILKVATEQIEKGVDKESVYKIIADNNNGKRNSNSIKDIKVANKVLEEIKNLKI